MAAFFLSGLGIGRKECLQGSFCIDLGGNIWYSFWFYSISIRVLFHQFHQGAGAQPVCAGLQHRLGRLEGADAAGGLDLNARAYVAGHQRHILNGGTTLIKAGGGLDIGRARLGDAMAQGDLLGVGQPAALDDHLQLCRSASPGHDGYLVGDSINSKLVLMPIEAQKKMRKTLGRIVNEGKGGVLCILL